MPELISIETAIEKNLVSSENVILIALEVSVIDPSTGQEAEVLRLVRNNEPITWHNNLYGPVDFEIEVKHSAGEVPSVSLNISDYTQAVQQKMQEYGGGVGFGVKMIVINTGNMLQPPELVETFIVTGASAANYKVSWALGALDPSRLRFPRRTQWRDRCSWRFKSAECGYTGTAPSCDLTLQGDNGCGVKGNSRNFGGCPGLARRFK